MLKFGTKNFQKPLKLGKGIIKFLLAVVIFLLCGLYYKTEIFNFSESKIDLSSKFYNPYTYWNKSNVVKANFHAHSKAWNGMTNGHNSTCEVLKEYKNLGYQVAAVSNYHHVSRVIYANIIKIPTYEHGFNVSKAHFLAINATDPNYLDFPFVQNLSHKQSRIVQLKESASLVAIAHPKVRNAFSKKDLAYLKGYDLFEVLSPYAESFDLWDYALQNGNLSWILANDDTHDLIKQPAGRFFNVISIQKKDKNSVINALKDGNHVSYASNLGITDVFLDQISVIDDKINYSFTGDIKKVRIIRNNQKFIASKKGEVVFLKNEKYVRFEVEGKISTLYTNPIYRINRNSLAANFSTPSKINHFKTFLYRINCLIVGSFFIALLYWKVILKKTLRNYKHIWQNKDFVPNKT